MKIIYRKLHQFFLFGVRVFYFKTDYIERQIEDDDEDDATLQTRIIDKEIDDED